ncbi:unnamed protein product [Caenorhabditis nigoni]
MTHPKTAIVSVKGYCTPEGSYQYSLNWGCKDHPNNYKAAISGFHDIEMAELHAARTAIKMAKKQTYTKIRILTETTIVWDFIKNSANFANAPLQVRSMVQAIHAHRQFIIIKVELIDGKENIEN